ncbi:major facilitator superfamily domain-containing protein [Diplogelasinospora grovesii]|uniref:Major facilitator superfamily domain-containing protein n=1 Tax=Diplogelasinospora grovesii TaxID=303347 RepID=A0AAN6S2J8_9PEZI|nr:major facilitator superfamily domain-containing protein [Diplogelasinospora grovesii]
MELAFERERPMSCDITHPASLEEDSAWNDMCKDTPLTRARTLAGLPSLMRDRNLSAVNNTNRRHSQYSKGQSDSDDDNIPAAGGTVGDEENSGQASARTAVGIGSITRPEPPYHIFTTTKKWQLVYIVSLAGLFSPLSSNIYFPALGAIAKEMKTDVPLVALTVTIYMVVQGLAPSFWGPLSDTRGRRITFIGTFAVFLLANIGLALSTTFPSLLMLRAVQAAGSAATISVGAGVIGDITTAKERGGFMGSFGGIRMLGQSIGPVIGGIITEYFGFRAIFWFLAILGSVALLLVLLFLPETLRRVAGNGTVRLKGIHRPLIYRFEAPHPDDVPDEALAAGPVPTIALSSVFSPLRFLFEKDVFVTLLFGAVIYTVWSMVTSSTTALFQPRYNLSDLQVGLVFLPNGVGCIAGSCVTGKLLDRDYGIVESQYRAARNLPADVTLGRKKLAADFPVTRARLRSSTYLIVPFVLAVGGYGFSITTSLLASREGMALPLVLQFVIAFCATAIFTQNSALMVDLFPGASASATAVNNLIRCSIGAAGVGVVQFVIDGIGANFAFLIFAGLSAALSPLLWVEWVRGEDWRRERIERLEREKAAKHAAEGSESGSGESL